MIKDIMLVGVGGQGVILAANLLARTFLNAGYYVKQSEIHGMAQRGGSVTTFVRRGSSPGSPVYSPFIEAGEADAILSFEKLEALRFAHYLKPDGLIVYSRQELIPTAVSALGAPYPDDIDGDLLAPGRQLRAVDVEAISQECNNPRVVNVALVGALAAYLGLPLSAWNAAIRATVPRALDANLMAFRLGMGEDLGE